MTADHKQLLRLLTAAHDTVTAAAPSVSAVQLYTEAARVAEQRLPGPLGTAVAGVLAVAGEKRRAAQMGGILGEHNTTLALALAVLDLPASGGS